MTRHTNDHAHGAAVSYTSTSTQPPSGEPIAPVPVDVVVDPLDRISLWVDFKTLVQLALPNSATYLVSSLVGFTSVLFLGRLGAEYMGAAAIGNMLANLFGFSIGSGATSALDALCSQAYGARSYLLVGRHTQRAMAALTMCCFPISLIWLNTATILSWMGIEEVICELAGEFVFILVIGMWPAFMFECLRRYLQAQSILWPILTSAITTALFSILLNYILIFQFDYGFLGPAIASALSQWCMFLTVVLCIVCRGRWRQYWRSRRAGGDHRTTSYAPVGLPHNQNNTQPIVEQTPPPPESPLPTSPTIELATLKHRGHAVTDSASESTDVAAPSPVPVGSFDSSDDSSLVDPEDCWPSMWSLDVFCGWSEFLKLAIPGSASLFVEWGSYEVSASMAARLGATNLAVHSIFMQTCTLAYAVPQGIATAAAISVGQFLGAGRGDRAKQIANLALVMHLIYPLIASFLLVGILRPYWGSMFATEEDVLASCAKHLPILILYLFFDHTKCVLMAVLRGCGRAPVTVWGNTLACWLVGFPMAYLLVFRNPFELFGLWTSMSLAWATASMVYYCVILRTDWSFEVEQARQRTERSLAATAKHQHAHANTPHAGDHTKRVATTNAIANTRQFQIQIDEDES